MADQPLDGLLVLDLTTFLSGPYGTQILGDLGARVIKVESPDGGDSTRALPPHFVHGTSAYFLSINRNKQSVVLDLKQPAGRDLLHRLVARADLVVENFRPGVAERLGIDYPSLRRVNPGVVLCSVTGFGQAGPAHQRPAYDAIVQALSGGMSMTGEAGRAPVRAGIPVGDLAAGMFGVIGALAALRRREVTGEGAHVDVSMLDSQISMLTYQAVYYLVSGQVPGPQGSGHVSIPTYRSFTCQDGRHVIVTANTERMWRGLCAAVAAPELADDPRFGDNQARLANRAALDAELEQRFAGRPAAEWLPRLLAEGVPAAPVNNVAEALADPQAVHRDMVVAVPPPAGGDPVRLVGNPVKLAGTAARFAHPPRLGEHTAPVLRELLGLSAGAIAELAAQQVIRCAGDGE